MFQNSRPFIPIMNCFTTVPAQDYLPVLFLFNLPSQEYWFEKMIFFVRKNGHLITRMTNWICALTPQKMRKRRTGLQSKLSCVRGLDGREK